MGTKISAPLGDVGYLRRPEEHEVYYAIRVAKKSKRGMNESTTLKTNYTYKKRIKFSN